MNRRDFVKLVKKAEAGPAVELDDEGHWMSVMDPLWGIALHQERRMVSEAGAITFLRYQGRMFNGQWDFGELENCQHYFKRVDLV